MSKYKIVSIDEICLKIVGGGTPSTKERDFWEGKIPWISSADISDSGEITIKRFITEEALQGSASNLVPKGTIIVVTRVGVGKSAIAPVDLCFSQDSQGLILKKELADPTYCHFALRRELFKLAKKARGATITGVTKEEVKKIKIPLPSSLSDQIRIATLLTHAEALMAQRKESLWLLDELVKGAFLEMFGDPVRNEMGWDEDEFENIVAKDCPLTYGIVQPGEDFPNGTPIVRPVDLTKMFIERKGLKLIDPKISNQFKRTILKGDEILMCVRGNTGVVSIASKELAGCNVTRGITPIWFSDNFNIHFAYILLKSKAINKKIQRLTYGATLKQINLSDLRKIILIKPPFTLQTQFATLVEKTESLKKHYTESLKELEQLYGSLSQRAFRGELNLSKVQVEEEIPKPSEERSQEEILMEVVARINEQYRPMIELVKIAEAFKHGIKAYSEALYNNQLRMDRVLKELSPHQLTLRLLPKIDIAKLVPNIDFRRRFTFEELWRQEMESKDYEEMKRMLFDWVKGENPFMEQFFDETDQQIKFRLRETPKA